VDLRRYIVELGTGADLHGRDVTKAAQRAVKDAVSRCCLCGLMEIFGFVHPNEMFIRIKVASPRHDQLDALKIKSGVPFGTVELETVEGGLETSGLDFPLLGQGDTIVVALASITVLVDLDARPIRPAG
jgi:uncharacterized protein (TIGR02058 family)